MVPEGLEDLDFLLALQLRVLQNCLVIRLFQVFLMILQCPNCLLVLVDQLVLLAPLHLQGQEYQQAQVTLSHQQVLVIQFVLLDQDRQ